MDLLKKDIIFNDVKKLKGVGKQFPTYSDISFFKLGDHGISLSEEVKA